MLDPELVRRLVYSMRRTVSNTEITVKCRLGVTGRESREEFIEFIRAVNSGGVSKVIIHARHCILKGLSPAQNRVIPPLRYDLAHEIVGLFPDMKFVINGGIQSFEQAEEHLGIATSTSTGQFRPESILGSHSSSLIQNNQQQEYQQSSCDNYPPTYGVMIGREAYNNPWLFASADSRFFGKRNLNLTPVEVAEKYLDYAIFMQDFGAFGARTAPLAKPLHNFFSFTSTYNKVYKHHLDEILKSSTKLNKDVKEIFWEAVEAANIPDEVLHTVPYDSRCTTSR